MRVTIRAARINRDLTQAEFARKIGVSESTIRNWESNKSAPRADLMPKICNVLNCEIEDIIFLPVSCG